jgi:hypothetical protein
VREERAAARFSRALAEDCREILWRDTGCDPHDPATWTKPVIRLGDYSDPPFGEAANAPALHRAFDQLVGAGRWLPRSSLGYSKGRALLMLFLFSDVGEDDAPTRIRAGSHRDIARRLAPAGDGGCSLGELATNGFAESAHRPQALATGPAGTVYLCHPFLVHAAQPHRGSRPRFMAQPPLHLAEPLQLERESGDYSPVEQAIRRAM